MTLSPPSIASTARHTHPPPVPVVPADERWADFNVDRLILRLAPFLPQQSLLHHLPRGISHFLGFRLPTPRPAQQPLPDMIIWTLAAAGAFVGISSVAGITQLLKLESHVVGSMGAAAILLFLTPLSPLAQPRNLLLSQLFASVIGVAVARFVHGWAAPAVAVALTALIMCVTRTVHPPAGATAVLAVVDGRWRFVGVVMASTGVLAAAAMVWVNLCGVGGWQGGRWPERWWWSEDVKIVEEKGKTEKGGEEEWRDGDEVVVGKSGIVVPMWLELGLEERGVLDEIWGRVRERRVGV